MPRLGPRIFSRWAFPLNWAVSVAVMLVLAAAGSLLAISLLTAVGYLQGGQVFAHWFSGALRVSIVVTLTFGIMITAYEMMRAQLDAATLALRTKERDEAEARRLAAEAQLASTRIAGAAALPVQHAELDRRARARRSGGRRTDDRPARLAAALVARQPARRSSRSTRSCASSAPISTSSACASAIGCASTCGSATGPRRPPCRAGAADAGREQRQVRRVAAPRGRIDRRDAPRRPTAASASTVEDDGPGFDAARPAGRARSRAAGRASGDAVRRRGVDARREPAGPHASIDAGRAA